MNCPSCNTPLHTQSDGQIIHPKADACAFSLVGLYPAGWEAVYGVKRTAFAEAASFAYDEIRALSEAPVLPARARSIRDAIRAMAAPEQKE